MADYQQLGALSVDALECEFGQHNFTATTGTNNAPMVHCPTPALMSPGFVVVRISRGFAAASLDAPAILLVKDDHAVRGAHPRQTWGPARRDRSLWVQFLAKHVEGTTDPTTSLCVFGGSGASGGVIVSSALILCESPLTEPTRAKERWVAPCFEECDAVHGAPRRRDAHQGARARRPHLHAALVPHEHRRTERMDARRHARARVALRRRRQGCTRLLSGATRVLARPAGVAVVETVAQAQGENIEIDCISPARPRGAVPHSARRARAIQRSTARHGSLLSLSLTKRDDFRPRRRSEGERRSFIVYHRVRESIFRDRT